MAAVLNLSSSLLRVSISEVLREGVGERRREGERDREGEKYYIIMKSESKTD